MDHNPHLRVTTLNVGGTRGDRPARRAVLTDQFADIGADLITLQETGQTSETDQVGQMSLGSGHYVVHQQARERNGQGISITSRWPIIDTVEIDLHVTERTFDFACIALARLVQAPEPFGPTWPVNHLPDWQLDHDANGKPKP